jgi:hypothetical protein
MAWIETCLGIMKKPLRHGLDMDDDESFVGGRCGLFGRDVEYTIHFNGQLEPGGNDDRVNAPYRSLIFKWFKGNTLEW